MQQIHSQDNSEEYYIQRQINKLRLYNSILIIIGLSISVIIIITAEPTTGIILLTISWALIGLVMVYLSGRIKNLNLMNNKPTPYSSITPLQHPVVENPNHQYAIPVYTVNNSYPNKSNTIQQHS